MGKKKGIFQRPMQPEGEQGKIFYSDRPVTH